MIPAAADVDPTAGLKPSNPIWLQSNLPCQSACPVGTHAGGYVSLIAQGHYREAYLLPRRPNPFASICGRVCAHPCEAACRRQSIDAPISIRALKRFVTERHGVESEASPEEILRVVERPRPAVATGGRVAVVGAGPAGLACAHDLALMGHQVVVFDAAAVAGGMMRLGIPEYRLPRELIQKEVDFISFLGVNLRLGVEIGTDIVFQRLRDDYDAVFLAPGCRRGRSLKIPGMEIGGVLTAQRDSMLALLSDLPAPKVDHCYAPGKWSLKEVVGHVIDAEWLFTYRALRFARGDATPLAGMDQDVFAAGSNVADRSLSSLIEEFRHLRTANIALFSSFNEKILDRTGVANDCSFTVRSLLYIAAGHVFHHLRILEERYL